MFTLELLRAGIQSREDSYPDWQHRRWPFRIWNRDHWSYKSSQSVRLILLAYRAGRLKEKT